jgi:hypothetical protein
MRNIKFAMAGLAAVVNNRRVKQMTDKGTLDDEINNSFIWLVFPARPGI